MKKALLKDSLKEIKNTYKRFISILLMAFLGVGFFAGIKASSPDMVDTIDTFYNKQNVYDIQVISTLGLTEEDIQALKQIQGVEEIVGSYEMDGQLDIGNKEVIVKTMTIEEINKPILKEGRLPETKEECVVEENFLNKSQMKIGDTIEVEIAKTTNKEGEEVDYLKQKQLKIVGTVQSPLYISGERGTSSLGTGKVNYYIYISEENIQEKETYTNIYLKVNGANQYTTSSKEYEECIEQVKNKIEDIKEERQTARHQELVKISTDKIEEAENTLNKEKQEAQTKIKEMEDKISKGKSEIQKAEEEIDVNEQKANNEFANGERKLKQTKEELVKQEETLKQKEQEANSQLSEAEKNKQELQKKLEQLEETLKTVNSSYEQIIEYLKNPNLTEEQKKELEQTKQTLEIQKQQLEQNKQQLIAGITQIEEGIKTANNQIQSGKQKLKEAKTEINKQEQKLKQTKANTYEQLRIAKEKINTSKQEIEKGEEELNKNKQELEDKIKEAEEKIIDSKQKIADIENPKWYILDRYGNAGYNGFIQDTESIAKIGGIFPIVFFIVAALISLTSMTRMVEEQRTQIGTLKALGYNKIQIVSKYIIYASLACIIGSILGMCVGFTVIPQIVWKMYGLIYQMIPIEISFNVTYGTIGLFLISICIIGATIYATMKELMSTPATLMRPKSPKAGKRVMLEKISFIWNHLSFSRKVTLRNLFRYKKRFLMTVIGILGCTSLILTGFGIKDSIASILPNQFEKIFNYDMQISLKNGLDADQKATYKQELEKREEIKEVVGTYMISGKAINEINEEDVQILIPEEDNGLDNMITLNDIKAKQETHLKDGEICITDKVAKLLGVKSGDTIILRDNDEVEKEIKISNVVENYIGHYVYMTKDTYENLYGKKYETNVFLTNNIDLGEKQEEKLATEIMNQKEVSSINRTSGTVKSLDDTMKSLNYIVLILIVSAGLLAFVVLYNLSNVNISEKIRELATIKVLGFYDKEVYDYVTRETILLTIIGILLGLVGGYFLNYFIVGTCELDMFKFGKVIEPISYIYAILITVGFTAIVNFVTYFSLKKINMIESLKSVE